MLPPRRAVADRPQGAQPLAGAWTPRVNHDQDVGSTGFEYLEDLGEHKKLATYLIHRLPAVRDMDLMGLHADFREKRSSTTNHSSFRAREPTGLDQRRGTGGAVSEIRRRQLRAREA